MHTSNINKIAIIGAGVAGLATARQLIAEGFDCTLFERNEVLGGVWSDGYLNFGVQVQRELYEFPDWPLPEDTPNFTPGPIIEKYLCDYADHFGISSKIRFNTRVTSLAEKDSPSPGWTITSENGGGIKVLQNLFNKPHLNGKIPASFCGIGQCGSRNTICVCVATLADSKTASLALFP